MKNKSFCAQVYSSQKKLCGVLGLEVPPIPEIGESE